jgi:hypothetical protein
LPALLFLYSSSILSLLSPSLIYLCRCNAKAWKKENNIDSHKCFSLERSFEAEMAGESTPEEIALEEFEAEAVEVGI